MSALAKEQPRPESPMFSCILSDLRKRNRRAAAMWSVCEEAEHARQELRAAKAAVHDMHHKNLATSLLSSSHAPDVAGLLSDTPIAPHMRLQVAKCVREKLLRSGEGDRLVRRRPQNTSATMHHFGIHFLWECDVLFLKLHTNETGVTLFVARPQNFKSRAIFLCATSLDVCMSPTPYFSDACW
jgi:hypothetical protein